MIQAHLVQSLATLCKQHVVRCILFSLYANKSSPAIGGCQYGGHDRKRRVSGQSLWRDKKIKGCYWGWWLFPLVIKAAPRSISVRHFFLNKHIKAIWQAHHLLWAVTLSERCCTHWTGSWCKGTSTHVVYDSFCIVIQLAWF